MRYVHERWRLGRRLNAFTTAVSAGLLLLIGGLAVRWLAVDDTVLQRYANRTQVLGLLLTAATIVVSLGRFVRDRLQAAQTLDEWADELAARVLRNEDANRKALLGGWVAADIQYSDELAAWFAGDGSKDPMRLEVLDEYFRGLGPRGRLVVLGQPGSGKTVTAIQLIVRRLADRAPKDRVPVRFNLAGWDDTTGVEQWMAERLTRDYGVPPLRAAELVEQQRILPVLDGLDEMDADDPGRPPRRALRVMHWLNREYVHGGGPAPVVVTCREHRYAELADRGEAVSAASEVRTLDLRPEQIAEYIRKVFDRDATRLRQWEPVLDRLDDPGYGAIWAVLATPWRLTLAVTLVRAGRDPSQLFTPRPDETFAAAAERIRAALVAEYVDAAVNLSAGPGPAPERVVHWLEEIARRLQRASPVSTREYSTIDIVPHRLVGDTLRIRLLHASIAALVMAAGSVVFALTGIGPLRRLGEGVQYFLGSDRTVLAKFFEDVVPFVCLVGAPVLVFRLAFARSLRPVSRTKPVGRFAARFRRNLTITGAAASAVLLVLPLDNFYVLTGVREYRLWYGLGAFHAEALLLIPVLTIGGWVWGRARRAGRLWLLAALVLLHARLGLVLVFAAAAGWQDAAAAAGILAASTGALAFGARQVAAIEAAARTRLRLDGVRRGVSLAAVAALLTGGAWLAFALVNEREYVGFGDLDDMTWLTFTPDRLAGWGVAAGLTAGLAGVLRRAFGGSIVIGFASGFAFGLTGALSLTVAGEVSLSRQLEAPVQAALGAVLAAAVIALLLRDPLPAEADTRTPLRSLRDDLLTAVRSTAVIGIPAWAVFAAGVPKTFGIPHATDAGSIVLALTAAVSFGLIGRRAWFRYLLGCLVAARRGALPLRLGHFLAWAATAGLLRMSGAAYQFRHLELQQWLLTQARPAPEPAPAAAR